MCIQFSVLGRVAASRNYLMEDDVDTPAPHGEVDTVFRVREGSFGT
jgi:hypothetical protein